MRISFTKIYHVFVIHRKSWSKSQLMLAKPNIQKQYFIIRDIRDHLYICFFLSCVCNIFLEVVNINK